MKKLILIPLLTASFIQADNINLEDIGINIGYGNLGAKEDSIAGNISIAKPKEDYSSFEINTKVKNLFKNDMVKPTLAILHSENSQMRNTSILLGINQYIKSKEFTVYVGLLGGYGILTWKYDPLSESKESRVRDTSGIVGAQIGLEYPMPNNIKFIVDSKYLIHDYETFLQKNSSNTSKLKHKNSSYLMFGLKYSF